MVILGLLIGTGIILAGSLIQGAHSKDVVAMTSDLSIAVRHFKERYGYLPGDLPDAADDISGIADASACDYSTVDDPDVGNGTIDFTTDSGTKSTETDCVSVHLYHSGFIRGGEATLRTDFGAVRLMSRVDAETLDVGADADVLVSLNDSIMNVIVFSDLPRVVVLDLENNHDDGVISSTFGKTIVSDDSPDLEVVPLFAVPL